MPFRVLLVGRLMCWGVLARGTVNLQSLTAPLLEPTRRAYLRRPAIIGLRLKHKTMGALAGAIAQTFVEALVEGDGGTIADLLNPSLFVPKGFFAGTRVGNWHIDACRRQLPCTWSGQANKGNEEEKSTDEIENPSG